MMFYHIFPEHFTLVLIYRGIMHNTSNIFTALQIQTISIFCRIPKYPHSPIKSVCATTLLKLPAMPQLIPSFAFYSFGLYSDAHNHNEEEQHAINYSDPTELIVITETRPEKNQD